MNRFQSACIAALTTGLVTAAAFAATPAGPAGGQEAVSMAAHHAVYKLTLLSAKGTTAPASASGVIDYDFAGSSCDGYTTNFRQLVEIQPNEGDSKMNDTRSSTFEDGAATQFTFKTRTSTDDDVSDLAGRAERASDGTISVAVKTPDSHANFGAEVLFPTEHLRHVIAAAERGEKILSADVFDGTDTGRKLYHTLTVIGAPIQGAPDDPAGRADILKGLRRWPVVISYFETGKDQPDYILSSDLYEDGISRGLKLDYGDFVLAGALDQLTIAPPVACRK